MKIITTLVLVTLISNLAFAQIAQIDTISIYKEVNSIKSVIDHKNFWKQVHSDDQGYRGKLASDSIDCLNLIKCCIYLNKFGYPDVKILGSDSRIISYVWIHNRFPQTDLLTFPIIMEGFRNKQINEDDFRNYYLRSIYKRQFTDEDYKTLQISTLLKKLKPPISKPINILAVTNLINKEQEFLNETHNELGVWYSKPKYDTLYLNNNTVIKDLTSSPIRLFQDLDGLYYYHKLHIDKSHYPQKLVKSKQMKNTFKLFEEQSSYIEIDESGDLKLVNEDGSYERYTTENKRR